MVTVIQLLGGRGTRLKSITHGNIPKPLVKVSNLTIVEQQINQCISFGCKNFVWICHFKVEAFNQERDRLMEKYKNLIDSIDIYNEELPLCTFGSLYRSIKNKEEKIFLVLYGDIVINFDLLRFYKSFKNYLDSDIHVFTRFSDHPDDSDKISIDDNGYIRKFISKREQASHTNPSTTTSGIYLARKELFEKLIHWSGQRCDLFSEVLPLDSHMINASSYLSSEFILDVGTEKRYKHAVKLLSSNDFYKKSYLFPKPSLLLDRDGVIIKSDGYITELSQIKFNDELIEIMTKLKKRGVLIGIITNQPHVAQGRINDYEHDQIKNYIIRYLAKFNAIDFYYECKFYPKKGYNDEVPFYKKSSSFRKPKCGMLQTAINEHNIDINKSIFIGDNDTDIIAGNNCFLKTFFYKFTEDTELLINNFKDKSKKLISLKNLLELY